MYVIILFITFWILFSYLVPISLFVTLEIVKFILVRSLPVRPTHLDSHFGRMLRMLPARLQSCRAAQDELCCPRPDCEKVSCLAFLAATHAAYRPLHTCHRSDRGMEVAGCTSH